MPVRHEETDERREAREAAERALAERTVVDVPTLALATGNAERVIREAINRGDIRVVRIGRSIRIPTRPLRRAWGLD